MDCFFCHAHVSCNRQVLEAAAADNAKGQSGSSLERTTARVLRGPALLGRVEWWLSLCSALGVTGHPTYLLTFSKPLSLFPFITATASVSVSGALMIFGSWRDFGKMAL